MQPAQVPATIAPIEFKLRKRQHLQVWMIRNGKRVSTSCAEDVPERAGHPRVHGVADDGVTLLPAAPTGR